mgnify:CR=1 FL=1
MRRDKVSQLGMKGVVVKIRYSAIQLHVHVYISKSYSVLH